MKFRDIEVYSKTIIANSAEELDEELNKLEDIYDLQFSTHCTKVVDHNTYHGSRTFNSTCELPTPYSVEYCALVLIRKDKK